MKTVKNLICIGEICKWMKAHEIFHDIYEVVKIFSVVFGALNFFRYSVREIHRGS